MRFFILILCVCYVRSEEHINYCHNGLGECTYYYLCTNGTFHKYGEGVLNERIEDDNCEKYSKICCPIEDELPKDSKCGIRNVDGLDDRFSNEEAKFGEFPWMVAVFSEKMINGTLQPYYLCGGSLIAENVVLTAAHCVHKKDPKRMKIRAGDWDPESTYDFNPHSDRYVDTFVVHDNYTKKVLYNDIALLFLESDVQYADNVYPICLPPENQSFDERKCIVTGWENYASENKGEFNSVLKKTEVPILPFNECQKELKNSRLGSRFTLHNSFMCAGTKDEGKNACKKDSGCPLVCPVAGSADQFFQAGIVSWGVGCGAKDVPGIYTNVAKFRNWIDVEIFNHNLFASKRSLE